MRILSITEAARNGAAARRLPVLLTLALCSSVSLASSPSAFPPGEKVLVDSHDLDSVGRLVQRGATKLEDYGSFALWVVAEDQARAMQAEDGLAIPEAADVIYLRGGQAIDTAKGPDVVASDLRQSRSTGEQFWMIQFIGPVKDE